MLDTSDIDQLKEVFLTKEEAFGTFATFATKAELQAVKDELSDDIARIVEVMATKEDLHSLEERMNGQFREVHAEISSLRTELRTEFRTELHTTISDLKNELLAAIREQKADYHELSARMYRANI